MPWKPNEDTVMEMPGNEVTFELLKEFAAQNKLSHTPQVQLALVCRDVQCRWLPGLSCSATTPPVLLQPSNQVHRSAKSKPTQNIC